MKKTINLSLVFVLFSISLCSAQSYRNIISTSTENTPDSIIFQNCLDSIEKYVYLDSRKVKPYKSLCEEMLVNKKELSNRHRLEFVIQSIYDEYNHNNSLGVFKIIETNRKMLDLDGIPTLQKTQFKYLEGYTALILGDIENAQRVFYEMLDVAKTKNDTSSMLQATNSLGKLFVMQNDFKNAEKYFLDYDQMLPLDKPLHKLTGYIELIELYLQSKQIDKAKYYNEIALQQADSLNTADLKLDFLLHKVSISIEEGNIDLAQNAHREASMIAQNIGNSFYQQLCQEAYAAILGAQNRFDEALLIYEKLIKEEEAGESVLTDLLTYYQFAYELADKKGDFEKGFKYVIKANEIKDSLSLEEQKQKSQYLTIKFEAGQKEKENILLTAQVLQKQSQNKLLYALMAIFLIGILFLIAAFLQKRKYNKRLKKEVSNRTIDLKNANVLLEDLNKELNQFNNILSHDLKEPLRSIVGFSSLASKELNESKNKRLIEYLSYINKSGKQLHQLIEDVSNFQSIGDFSSKELQVIDMNLKIHSIIEATHSLLQEKKAVVKFNDLPKIYSSDTLLFLIFKNLIENGIKFNQSTEPIIHISHEQKDGFNHFLVKDNGIGIAPEFHKRVFGMFKRLHNRETYEGSGLGLNIVKKLLHRIGGNICILESEENKGSTFQVSLPIVKQISLVASDVMV